MDRTYIHCLARFLAPVALVGSLAAATPLAHAATAPQSPAVATQPMSSHTPSPNFTITICMGCHCVTIKF